MLKSSIQQSLSERILVLDGGFGTMVQAHNLSEEDFRGERFAQSPVSLKGCNDLLALTRPGVVRGIHEAYLKAGADIISTDSFNANAFSLADFQLEGHVYEINYAAATLAREEADRFTLLNPSKPRFVAGSVGPTSRSGSISSDLYHPAARSVSFEELQLAYSEQIRGLLEGGVDVILIETVFDTLNAKAALFALDALSKQRAVATPVMVSATLSQASGRTLSGQTLEAFYLSLSHGNLLSVGLNCSFGAEQMISFAERLSRIATCPLSVHPNAGLPDAGGSYSQTPEVMAQVIERYLEQGLLNIVGGCCGTTPAHIAALATLVPRYEPRKFPHSTSIGWLSGWEELSIHSSSPIMLIGNRARVDDPSFAKMIHDREFEGALSVMRSEGEQGAGVISLCLDDPHKDIEATTMRSLIYGAMSDPGVAPLPLLVDSNRQQMWTAALGATQGRSLVRAVTLKKGDAVFTERVGLIRSYGALPVVLLLDEQGWASNTGRALEVALRAGELLNEVGFLETEWCFELPVEGILLQQLLQMCEKIRRHFPKAQILLDISSVGASLAPQSPMQGVMQSVFIDAIARKGASYVVADSVPWPLVQMIVPQLRAWAIKVLFDGDLQALSQLHNYTGPIMSPPQGVVEAIIQGDQLALESRFKKETSASSEVLMTQLIESWYQLGRLYGDRALLRPQLIMVSKALKKGVGLLYEQMTLPQKPAGRRVMLPSLKGDIQDAGKSLTRLRLLSGGFQIEELSGAPTPQRIIQETISHQVDLLVLCGMSDPFHEELFRVVAMARRQGLTIPIVICTPVAMDDFVDKELQPIYSGRVKVFSAQESLAELFSL